MQELHLPKMFFLGGLSSIYLTILQTLLISAAKLAYLYSISCWHAASIAYNSIILPRIIQFSSIAQTRAARSCTTSLFDGCSITAFLCFVGQNASPDFGTMFFALRSFQFIRYLLLTLFIICLFKSTPIILRGNFKYPCKQYNKNISNNNKNIQMLPSSPTKTPYKNKNKFNYHSTPVFPIHLNQQLQILSLEISEHGRSGGVIFIESTQGAFVLKANNQASQDFFYNQLAMYMDVNVPRMLTLGCYEPEFQALVFLIEKYCHSDEVLYARLKTKLDFPFYEIMEYIPSISLAHVGLKKYEKHMLTQYKMYCIGICIGFDMIINNNDRFTLVWRGQGNINNILIEILNPTKTNIQKSKDREDSSTDLGNFMYIDHDGHMIDYENQLARPNADKYIDMVTQFQLNMVQYLRKQNSSPPVQFDKLIKQVGFFTQYSFTEEDIVKISEGIIYCTKKFIDFYEEGQIKVLHQSMQKPTNTKNKEINYWNQHWNNQFKKVNINFCHNLYVKVSALYTTYPELINEIYERVKKCVDKNKNRQPASRKPSQISRKNSEVISNKSQDLNAGKQTIPNEPEENQQDKRKRKWREKLVEFKTQNYK